MPKLVRLYITQVLIGFILSAIFVGVLLALNVANLRGLIFGSEVGPMALGMIWFMNGVVFAGVQFAWKIMSMAEKPDKPRGGTPVALSLKPAFVKQKASERR